jgi:hypothetical protein
MKLESILISALVAVGAFILCLTVMGDSIITQQYYSPLASGNYTSEFPKTLELQRQISQLANSSYNKAANPSENKPIVDVAQQLMAGWQQTVAAFEIATTVIKMPFTVQGSASEVGGFLRINGFLLVLIFTFLIIAVTFSIAAFFRGRRA